MTTTATLPVQGHCPLGCGKGLQLLDDGRIMCRDLRCEHPYAVTELLSDRETGHLVHFAPGGSFTIKHPLMERLDDDLLRCGLGDYLAALEGPPGDIEPGIYRAVLLGDLWTWGIPVTATSPPLPHPEPSAGEPLPAAELNDPVIDPDCRDGKCGSCVGGLCEHRCHSEPAPGAAA